MTDIVALELQKIGLTLREAQMYLTILEHPNCNTKLLVTKLGLTRPSTHRVLKTLLDKDMIRERKTGPRTASYSAISPDELLSLLSVRKRAIAEQERELQRVMVQLRQRDVNMHNTIATYPNGTAGENTLYERLAHTDAHKIYVFITSAKHFDVDALHKAYNTIMKSRGSQVTIHEIIAPGLSTFPRHAAVARTKLTYNTLGTGFSVVVADCTFTVSDKEIVMIDVPHLTEFHRTSLAQCSLADRF